MNTIVALLVLSFLIIVHEFGHFIVAKLSGIKVDEFSVFMGPKLFSVKKGETLYSFRLIPMGGYVKMEGEESASTDDRAYNKKPILVRAAVIAAGPIMNLIIALIIIVGMTFAGGYNTTRISLLDPTSSAAQAGLQKGDEVLRYAGKRIYTMTDLQMFMIFTGGKPSEMEYIRDGETKVTTVTPETIPKNRYIIGFIPSKSYGEGSNVVQGVNAGSNAGEAGLKAGDTIIRLNDKPVTNNREIRDFMSLNGGKPIDVWILRDGREQKLVIEPVSDKNEEQYVMGLLFSEEKGGFLQTIKQSFINAYSTSRNIYYSLVALITGKFNLNQMSGPVGIVVAIGDVVQQSPDLWYGFLNLLAVISFISINLGLFNLIPFPALDGSKLLLLAIEGIRRKALPPEKEALISMIGFGLLMLMTIFATANDILRLMGKG